MKKLRLLSVVLAALLLLLCDFSGVRAATPRAKYEVRAVWLTTVYGLDWPKSSDEGRQKRELTQLLDRLQVAGINTIFLQVRGRGDLIYPSSVEPGNPLFLKSGKFTYDPLAFALDECHKRGMAVHAWLVALPLGSNRYLRSLSSTAYAKLWPGRTIKHSGEVYMDPANPATAMHLRRIVVELLQKYPLDGIHLDYIRYPENIKRFPDKAAYQKADVDLSLHEWRTQNINHIVREVRDEIKQQCPTVLLSCATIGTYQREIANYDRPGGWTALDDTCQDPVAWAKDSLVDFVVPMHYIRGRSFTPIVEDWKQHLDIPIVIGLGAYRVLKGEGNWPVQEVLKQTALIQNDSTISGVCFFRADQVADLALRLHQPLRDSLFSTPVLPHPAFHSPDSVLHMIPSAPTIVSLDKKSEKGMTVLWSESDSESKRLIYSVYFSSHAEDPDTDTGDDLIAVTTATAYTIPWAKMEVEDLITLRIGAYDTHTGLESLSDEVSYYRRSPETAEAEPAIHSGEKGVVNPKLD